MSLALRLVALARVTETFDPSLHPRFMSGEHGGEFRALLDRAVDALKDDGTALDGLKREQLRDIARPLGVPMRRGISKPALIHEIKARAPKYRAERDAKAAAGPTTAAKKAAPTPTAQERTAAGYPDVPPGIDMDEDQWSATSYDARLRAIVAVRSQRRQAPPRGQHDAPTSMSDLAHELDGLSVAEKRAKMRGFGFDDDQIGRVLADTPARPSQMHLDPRDRRDPDAGPRRFYRGLRSSMLHNKEHDFSDLSVDDLHELRDFIGADPRRDPLHDQSLAAVDKELKSQGGAPSTTSPAKKASGGAQPGPSSGPAAKAAKALDAAPAHFTQVRRQGASGRRDDTVGESGRLSIRGSSLSAAETQQLADNLYDHQGAEFEHVNDWLRGTPGRHSIGGWSDAEVEARRPGIEAQVASLDRLMAASTLTSDVEVWRGTRSGRGTFGDRLDGDLTGFEWSEDGYASTSVDETAAKRFAGQRSEVAPGVHRQTGVLMRVAVPRGTGAVNMSGIDVGGSDVGGTNVDISEAELLLQRGMSMRVVRDHGVGPDGVRRLDVEAHPASRKPSKALGVVAAAKASDQRAAPVPGSPPGEKAAAKRVPVPQAGAARAPKERPEETRARLDAATSRDEGRDILKGKTIAELREISPTSAAIAKNKHDLVEAIVGLHIGGRLSFRAIAEDEPGKPDFGRLPKKASTAVAKVAQAKVAAPKPAKVAKAVAPKPTTRADVLLANDMGGIARAGDSEESLRKYAAKQSLVRIQGAGRVLGVDLSGLDKDTAAGRLAAHARETKPGWIDPGQDPIEALAERVSSAPSEDEMRRILSGVSVADLRKIAKETGVGLIPGDRDQASIAAHIARSLAAFGMSDPRGRF